MHAEVCVVGGGPAGASIAARLAALGHEVVLVERAAFPREHVGESLNPGVWPLLDVLGVGEVPRLRPTSRVRWGGVERVRAAGEGGATVDRGAFDALLLRHAAACGVDVRTSTAMSPARSADGWQLALREAAGGLRATFLVDASGRRRLLGGGRRRSSPRMLCLHARWRGAPADETLVEQRPDCWLWGAPLPDGTFRAMAFVDSGRLRERGIARAGMPAHYLSLLAGSQLMAALARAGAIAGRVGACDATCFVSRRVIDERSVRVGEAAFAIDPLSSSGVQVAIQTALAAATAVHTILASEREREREPAIEFYAEQVRHAAARHGRLAAGFYAQGEGESAFWRAREGEPAPPARHPGRSALADLLAHPIRLSQETTVAATPCVVGDRVERRPALAHPALERPVVFLGGLELVPLVVAASAAPTLRAAIDGWSAAGVAPPAAHAVARWLADHGVIERAG
ncbi:MAG TPA: tryptophan 7-halogenase [Solirubrobacteraceae bacterium]|jgi:flavin-dependent dehydrogenase|nr:tryptophan 7-halogenase [Solirubrobacteraceae bacterium]